MVHKYELEQGLNTNTFPAEAENMDKRWSAVFLLALVLCVFVNLDSASAFKPTREPDGECVFTLCLSFTGLYTSLFFVTLQNKTKRQFIDNDKWIGEWELYNFLSFACLNV